MDPLSREPIARGGPSLVDRYLVALGEEFPKLRIVYKAEDRLSRLVDRILRVLTLGGQSAYQTRYVTTIGSTIYLPSDWDSRDEESRYITLRHEAVHLRQFRRFTVVGMALLYLFPLLPMGLALGRARLEWEAYAETMRVIAEVRGSEALDDPTLRTHIVRQFTGPAYGWMWPFPRQVERWLAREASHIRLSRNRVSG